MSLREQFEAFGLASPLRLNVSKLGDESSWPGQYRDYRTELAWITYQAGYAARKKEVDDIENARAADTLENSLKPTRSTPRTPINEVDY